MRAVHTKEFDLSTTDVSTHNQNNDRVQTPASPFDAPLESHTPMMAGHILQ